MKQHKQTIKRLLCFAFAVLTLSLCAMPSPVFAETPAEKADRLEMEYQAEQDRLNSLQSTKKKEEQAKKSLQNLQGIVKAQIEALVEKINLKISEIAMQEQAIADKQAEIDQRWSNFKQRMQAMQVMHDGGAVAMITSAKSMYDLLTFSDTLQQIAEKDTQVLEDMKQQRAALDEERQKLEADKAELEADEAKLEEKQGQLSNNIQQQNEKIDKATADAEAQKAVVAEKQKAYEQAEREKEAWIKQNASSGSGTNADGFIWPLPGQSRITTYFGGSQNLGGVIQNGHSGIDIAAPKGTPILAAHSGTVSSTSGHYSYGNMVMLDNGDGVATLYAHMNSIAVSAGQAVNQGDVVGYVGNTGVSFGNHLHWEVRINGVRQNPLSYASP